jgi:hypothetical protein
MSHRLSKKTSRGKYFAVDYVTENLLHTQVSRINVTEKTVMNGRQFNTPYLCGDEFQIRLET